MTLNELNDEIEACKEWEEECEKIGQGVNSKEGIRYRNIINELLRRLSINNITVNEAIKILET